MKTCYSSVKIFLPDGTAVSHRLRDVPENNWQIHITEIEMSEGVIYVSWRRKDQSMIESRSIGPLKRVIYSGFPFIADDRV